MLTKILRCKCIFNVFYRDKDRGAPFEVLQLNANEFFSPGPVLPNCSDLAPGSAVGPRICRVPLLEFLVQERRVTSELETSPDLQEPGIPLAEPRLTHEDSIPRGQAGLEAA